MDSIAVKAPKGSCCHCSCAGRFAVAWLLYAATGLLRRADDPLGNWGRSIAGRHKKGGHKKACGAIARRIACALWEVHRRGVPFTYEHYTLAQELVCPLTPLSTLLPSRAVRLLRDAGIRNSHQLATAYREGKLAAIAGFGDASIALVKQWVAKTGKFVREKPANLPGADASGETGTKNYTLDPGLKFHKQGANRKDSNEQNPQTQQVSPAAEHAQARPARPAAAPDPGTRRRRRARGSRHNRKGGAA